LANASGRPVLTVGETQHFARDGGIIGSRLEEKKVRFGINLNEAEQAQLKISAKLLSLAKTVLGNSRGD
jgi:YfiR/HmsC-like